MLVATLAATVVAAVTMTSSPPPAPPLAPVAATTSNIVVTNAAGHRFGINPLLFVGQTIIVRATGFQPRETVLVGPAALAWTSGNLTSDAAGVVSQRLRVPAAAADQPRGLLTLVGTQVPGTVTPMATGNIDVGVTNTVVFAFHTDEAKESKLPPGRDRTPPAHTDPHPDAVQQLVNLTRRLSRGLLDAGALLFLGGSAGPAALPLRLR
jgi:hypothetical protein